MDTTQIGSKSYRVGSLPEDQVPSHMAALPDEAHIVEGNLEAHGAGSFASPDAHLSAKVIKLERTESGGIHYQVAILVSEPTKPVSVETLKPEDQALHYLASKGFTGETAKAHVAKFGVQRILDAKRTQEAAESKSLDDELKDVLSGEKKALPETSSGTVQ